MLRSTLLYSCFERKRQVTTYGFGNGAWDVVADTLTQDSVVISVGVGHDISFDLAVSERHGCRILMMDPSPTGRATIEAHNPLPANMTYLPVGLSAQDGEIAFAAPSNPDEGSFRLAATVATPISHRFPCRRLQTILREQNLGFVDLLKLDIEGFEYEVLDEVLASKCRLRQICVELHHDIVPGITRWDSFRAILKLRLAGYVLVHHRAANFTFYKTE